MDGIHQTFKQTNTSPLQLTHHSSLNVVHNDAFDSNIILAKANSQHSITYIFTVYTSNMDATDYWPMAREYLIWNAAL